VAKQTDQFAEQFNFTGGEIAAALWQRSGPGEGALARVANGLKICRNMVVLPEGGVTRRPGTRYVLPFKTESQLGRFLKFRYSGSDSYTLHVNGGVFRWFRNGGAIEDTPGHIMEMSVPWLEADLTNIRADQAGSQMWLACRGYEVRVLTRGPGHTSWVFSTYRPTGGPVKTQNLDIAKTIKASATTGAITLTGVGTAFDAGEIGTVYRLDESDLSITPLWKAQEEIATVNTAAVNMAGGNLGDMTNPGNGFDGNAATYASKATASTAWLGRSLTTPSAIAFVNLSAAGGFMPLVDTATVTAELYGKQGAAPANATDGTKLGSQQFNAREIAPPRIVANNQQTVWAHVWVVLTSPITSTIQIGELVPQVYVPGGTAVLRRYNGNVYEAISLGNTQFTPPTHSDGDVQSSANGVIWRYRHSNSGYVRITAVASALSATADVLVRLPDSVAATPTFRWFPPAWNATDGWPEGVRVIDRGLFFYRGPDFWMTTVDNPNDITAGVLENAAIIGRLQATKGLPDIQWVVSSGVIVLGCRDNEVLLRAPGVFDPIEPLTIRRVPASSVGSAPHVPAELEDGAIFIGRSRKRLHVVGQIAADTQKLEPSEISIGCKHLFKSGAAALAWQHDPLRVLWIACADDSLAGITYMPEQQVVAGHSHPLTNGVVEDVLAIPTSDEGASELYLAVRRTINGSTRRYIEQLQPYDFTPPVSGKTSALGAWFLDCALRYQGAPATTISGLGHLEGQLVGVLADGAPHAGRTVTAGAITLDYAAADVLIGLPIDARARRLPANVPTQGGSTRGESKRAPKARIARVDSVGGSLVVGKVSDRGEAVRDSRPEAIDLSGTQMYGGAPPLVTDARRVALPAGIGSEIELEVIAGEGLPLTVTGLAPDMDPVEN
jgi:hypothetical protein